MTTLTIRRCSTTVHGHEDDGPRVERLLRGVLDRRLDAALDGCSLPPGHWCLRRLDVPVRLDLDRPGPVGEAQWAAAITDALVRAVAERGEDVVHYRRTVDALADLLTATAAGRVEREWAWRRLGLLAAGDPSPAAHPAAAILAVLRRHPEVAPAAVCAAVSAPAGAATLHRTLGADGWTAVATLVTGGLPVHAAGADGVGGDGVGADGVGADGVGADGAGADGAVAEGLLHRSPVARALRSSRVRPDAATRRAWAALVVAEADPSTLRRSGAAAILDRVATSLAATGDGRVPPSRPAGGRGSSTSRPVATSIDRADPRPTAPPPQAGPAAFSTTSPHTSTTVTVAAEPADAIAPTLFTSDGPEGRTCWGGLPFLLATAADAGIPDDVLDDPAFAARSVRWVLQSLGALLVPAPTDDPAVLALAGLGPDGPSQHRGSPPADAAEQARLLVLAQRWATVTRLRLGPDLTSPPREVVQALAGRSARVVADPGWLEVHLELAEVDVAVRRAGLDVDPGWVPWLGTVVRFCYG